MLEGLTCVYRSNVDLFFYVIGSSAENELILVSVLNCLYDAVSQILRLVLCMDAWVLLSPGVLNYIPLQAMKGHWWFKNRSPDDHINTGVPFICLVLWNGSGAKHEWSAGCLLRIPSPLESCKCKKIMRYMAAVCKNVTLLLQCLV